LRPLITLLVTFLFLHSVANAQDSYEEKVTTAANIGLTVSNIGLTGNCFKGNFNLNHAPSCEYPRGSGIEHLFEGGLWVGAVVNGQTLVSTGAIDDASGYSTGKSGFEFTAGAGSHLVERSSQVGNPLFSPYAISHQDFISDFTDSNITVPGTKILIQNHTNPLDIAVHFEAYNWNYSFSDFFVILNFTIRNKGTHPLDSVYSGYWFDGVVRNINITPPGGSPFFNKGGNGYIDSLHMAYCFDATGDTAFTRSYFGVKYLGAEDKTGFHTPGVDATQVYYNPWQYNNAADPIYFSPTNDNLRYNKLSQGLNTVNGLDFNDVLKTVKIAGNRATLISAGPYKTLNPGDSLNVVFAIVCARMTEDGNSVTADNLKQKAVFIKNAQWAQRTYNGEDANANGRLDPGEDRDHNTHITRYILPAPPDVPQVKIIPGDHKIDLYWSKNPEFSVDPISHKKDFEGYRIYKSKFGFDVKNIADVLNDMELVSQYDRSDDTISFNTGFDSIMLEKPVVFEGDTVKYYYKYTINNIEDGWQHAIAVTAFDQGDPANNLESLESSRSATLKRVFPGTPANNSIKTNAPFAYPNPYYAGAEWEGNRKFEEDRKLIFANLPAHCVIKVFTPAGDLVKTIQHNQEYNGNDIRWFQTNSDPSKTVFSGGEHAWDLLSDDNQIIARGLYLFYVEDLETGRQANGKFIVIK
jgi:hypothetical protein